MLLNNQFVDFKSDSDKLCNIIDRTRMAAKRRRQRLMTDYFSNRFFNNVEVSFKAKHSEE